MKWIESQACGAGEENSAHAHCVACRSSVPFRRSLLRLGQVDTVDFACPKGFTAETAPRLEAGGPRAGSELKRVLAFFRIFPEGGCQCDTTAAEMDLRGPEWCRENIDRIVGVMREEAGKRRLPFVGPVARRLLLLAIWRAERRAKG